MKTTTPGKPCEHCGTTLPDDAAGCPGCRAVIAYSAAVARRAGSGMAGLAAHRDALLQRLYARHSAGVEQWSSRAPAIEMPDFVPDAEPETAVRWMPIGFVAPGATISPLQVSAKLSHQRRPYVSYALQHCGRGAIERLTVQNMGTQATPAATIEVRLVPGGYGEAWVGSLPSLAPHEQWHSANIRLPLSLERLKAVRETEHAQLQIRVRNGADELFAVGTGIAVHAYNEWVGDGNFLEVTAAFVQSNDPALATVLQAATLHLEKSVGRRAFNGYQSGDANYVVAMLDALHTALSDDLAMSYINPPPSHETTGQKLQLVGETLSSRVGTCFDLAVLQAALWERVGLSPVIVLVPGHALLGCWTQSPPELASPVTVLGRNRGQTRQYIEMMNRGVLLMVNSVEIAQNEALPLACQHAAQILGKTLNGRGRVSLIDVSAARRSQPPITPLP